MPNDITKEDVKNWKKAHNEATLGGIMPVPVDVTYAGCYIGEKLRKDKLLSRDEIDDLLFALGRHSFMDIKNTWKRAMEKYSELKENKIGLK